jgi:hypothetical protein
MKKAYKWLAAPLLAALATLSLGGLTGCDNDDKWSPVELEYTALNIHPDADYATVGVKGGSGDFTIYVTPRIDDVTPAFELGFLSAVYNADSQTLKISPSGREGTAMVTVVDNKSGRSAQCMVNVARYEGTPLTIDAIRTSVDAESPEAIEADLAADTSVPPVGGAIRYCFYDMAVYPPVAEWMFADANGNEIASGNTITKATAMWSTAYDFLPINQQILFKERWTLGTHSFDIYTASDLFPTSRMTMPIRIRAHMRFYEDLTEYYKNKYPDAGVHSVARVLIINPK